jgi:flavodoxin I
MKNVGIFYGSLTGNTESAAKQIQKELGTDVAKIFDTATAKASDIEQFSNLIFGASTWDVGEMEEDFEGFLPKIASANLTGKKVALFGCGDQESYPDTFVDAMGEIYEAIKDKGCEVVGMVSTEGYEFDASKAVVDGRFVGLPLDEDNQSDLTEKRIKNWVSRLKEAFI